MKTSWRVISAAALALSLASTSWAGPPPSRASKPEFEKAQALFDKAKDLLQKGKLQEAEQTFHKSYEVVASPISLLFEARCLATMGKPLEAHRMMTDVIHEAKAEAAKDPKYQETAQAAETERNELASQVALVVVRIEDPAATGEVTIGGMARPGPRATDVFAVSPGPVEIVFARSNGTRETKSATAVVGQRVEIVVAAVPKAEPVKAPPPPVDDGEARRKNLRIGAYVAGGIAVVGFGLFAFEGSKSKSRYDDLKAACNGGPCPPDRADEVSSGRKEQKLANIGLAVGVVGAAAGATLFVLSRPPKREQAGRVELLAGPGAVGLKGTFR